VDENCLAQDRDKLRGKGGGALHMVTNPQVHKMQCTS
jgi:hypothetical protein